MKATLRNAADALTSRCRSTVRAACSTAEFNEQILRRLSSVSGVQAASLVTYVANTQGGGVSEREFSMKDDRRRSAARCAAAIVETTHPNISIR